MVFTRNYKKKVGPQKQKRWFIDAQMGKNAPFGLGGTGFRAGNGPLTKRSIVNTVRNTILEDKQFQLSNSGGSLAHNTIYSSNLLGNIPIQVGSNGRLGQKLHMKPTTLNIMLTGIQYNSYPIFVRILVVKSNAQYHSGSNSITSGLGSTDIFETGHSELIIAPTDTNKCIVLHDQIVRFDVTTLGSPGTADTKIINIPLKGGNFEYLTTTSNYMRDKNMYLVFIPYMYGGTPGTTVLSTVLQESCINFTDSS